MQWELVLPIRCVQLLTLQSDVFIYKAHAQKLCNKHYKNMSHNVFSKFTILCWAEFIVILGYMSPTGHRLESPPIGDL